MLIDDVPGSNAIEIIANELGFPPYDFDTLDFRPGDVVLDLGAHVGAISIYLAKRYPELRIIAVEPTPPIFACLERNLSRNKVENVEALNVAVTGDGREVHVITNLKKNSGGSTVQVPLVAAPWLEHFAVPSLTLDDFFERFSIDRCKLLKIDIEGSEHEVLGATTVLARVDNIRGEFHENRYLIDQGKTIDNLLEHCARFVPRERIQVTRCHMWEGDLLTSQ